MTGNSFQDSRERKKADLGTATFPGQNKLTETILAAASLKLSAKI
jgi:hypothetical protein